MKKMDVIGGYFFAMALCFMALTIVVGMIAPAIGIISGVAASMAACWLVIGTFASAVAGFAFMLAA